MVCLNKCCHFATYPTITFSQNLKFAAQKSVVLKKNHISPQGRVYLPAGKDISPHGEIWVPFLFCYDQFSRFGELFVPDGINIHASCKTTQVNNFVALGAIQFLCKHIHAKHVC